MKPPPTIRLLGWFLRAVRREGLWRTPLGLVRLVLFAARAERVPKAAWRARWKACSTCQVYDRKERTCRKGRLGCGCVVPLRNIFIGENCWAWQVGLADPEQRVGWPTPNYPHDKAKI